MVLPIVPFIVMIGGVAVRYATKKLATAAVKNMGGKLLSKPTQKILDKAVSSKSLKNNPTMLEKVKSQIGVAPKQTRTMPRPGKIDQKKGIAVGKLAQTAYKRQKQLKVAALMLGTGALAYVAGKDDKDNKVATKDTKGKAQADTKKTTSSSPPQPPKRRPKAKKKVEQTGVTFTFTKEKPLTTDGRKVGNNKKGKK